MNTWIVEAAAAADAAKRIPRICLPLRVPRATRPTVLPIPTAERVLLMMEATFRTTPVPAICSHTNVDAAFATIVTPTGIVKPPVFCALVVVNTAGDDALGFHATKRPTEVAEAQPFM